MASSNAASRFRTPDRVLTVCSDKHFALIQYNKVLCPPSTLSKRSATRSHASWSPGVESWTIAILRPTVLHTPDDSPCTSDPCDNKAFQISKGQMSARLQESKDNRQAFRKDKTKLSRKQRSTETLGCDFLTDNCE